VIVVNSGTVCAGLFITLTANGVNTFTWNTGATSNSIAVSPLTNTIYTVSGNLTGCALSASNTATVSVLSTPTVLVNSGAICSGDSFTIIPSGASTYTYSSGSAVVTPSATTDYSVIGTATNGCMSNAPGVASITVNPLPVITVNSGTICAGDSFTLSPSGASTYTFSGGSAIVTPTATDNYSVTGTSTDGCVSVSAAIASVIVNAQPTVNVVSTSTLICMGESATLNASGANSYSWSNGAGTSTIIITPTATGIYTVTGTDANNCSAIAIITQSVSDCLGFDHSTSNISGLAFQVYPNPSSGIFKVEFGFDGKKTITVYNEIGEVIQIIETNNHVEELNLEKFARGVYFVHLKSDSTSKVINVIKN
jgi:hypothetical protein